MPNLYMLIGPPGSGKSYWVSAMDDHHAVILSTDRFLERQAKLLDKTYNDVFKEYIKEADSLMRHSLLMAIKNDFSIIWDQTNVSKKSRAKKLNKIPKHYRKIALLFQTDYDTLMKVNDERKKIGRSIPFNILQSMYDTIELPTLDEGFDEIQVIERK